MLIERDDEALRKKATAILEIGRRVIVTEKEIEDQQ